MPDATQTTTAWDILKTILPWITGGVGGAFVTYLLTNKRNKIQPISRKISVSYIDLPEVVQGYSALITLSDRSGEFFVDYYFEQLAIIQLELKNTGNKDLDKFDFGVNIPLTSKIIGVQSKGEDRKHIVTYEPEISMALPSSQIDFELKPFNRKDTYKITIVVDAKNKNISDNIELSKTLPIKFVDENTNNFYSSYPVIISITITVIISLVSLFIAPDMFGKITVYVAATMAIVFLLDMFLLFLTYRIKRKK